MSYVSLKFFEQDCRENVLKNVWLMYPLYNKWYLWVETQGNLCVIKMQSSSLSIITTLFTSLTYPASPSTPPFNWRPQ